MKLYYAPGACSLAPHIVLRETGANFTLEKVDLAAKKTETGADFSQINPKGYVPVLQLDDGEILTEGIVMQQYLADKAPASKLAPERGTTERRRLEEMLVFLSTEVHKAFSPLFSPVFKDDVKAAFRERVTQRLDLIEKNFADGRNYATGNQFTIADAYLYTLTNWTTFVGIDLAKWPKLSAYASRVAARPAVQAALKAEGLMK
ncbi:MAG: glutathione transferase GstA [Alphaproteobacteria bacterium]|nr:glutathione transferase GstA [Alphaproteobacteria bacterium]